MNEYFFHDNVSGQQMDWLWANGWRHFGTYFYRYARTVHAQKPHHVMPLRIKLDKFKKSQSQKRIFKKNKDLHVCFTKAVVSAEVEDLFAKHKRRFKDNVPDSIFTFVSAQPASVPCECLSLALYLDGRLVGMSYLDVGECSTSSVYQCFDPNLSERSLGIFMVLCSVDYSLAHGKTFYYHGYAYKENSHYDYKKRFSGLETLDWERGSWCPMLRSST